MLKKWKKFSKSRNLKIIFWLIFSLSIIYFYQNRYYYFEIAREEYYDLFAKKNKRFDKNHNVVGLGIRLPSKFTVFGIDVSRHQGRIDWEKLNNQTFSNRTFSFAFIKATEGSIWEDIMFEKNWEKAKNTSLICGAYHFYRPGVDADKQVNNFNNKVDLESGDLPPVLDVEKISKKLSIEEHQKEILDILQKFEAKYHAKPIIYTNEDIFKTLLNTKYFAVYPLWIAKYHTKEPIINSKWKFWQFSEQGIVDGVDEYVDINVFRGNIKDLRKMQIP